MQIKSRNPFLVVFWSYGLFVLMHTVLYIHFFIAMRLTGASFGEIASNQIQSPQVLLSQGLVGMILGIPLLFILLRFLWRRSREWVGLHFDARHVLGGTVLGVSLVLLLIGVLRMAGIARVTGWPHRFSSAELAMLLVGQFGWILFKTLAEELVFRGMATREFALRWGWPLAIVAGGVYFALGHMVGLIPLLSWPFVVALLAAGIIANAVFTLLFLRGGSLSLPFGFHFGWNFTLAAIVGTVLSGTERSFGLFEFEMNGAPLLTGGAFGVELSIVALALFVGLALCFYFIPVGGSRVFLPSGSSK